MKVGKLFKYIEPDQYIVVWTDTGRLLYSGYMKDLEAKSWWDLKFIKLFEEKYVNGLHLIIKEK